MWHAQPLKRARIPTDQVSSTSSRLHMVSVSLFPAALLVCRRSVRNTFAGILKQCEIRASSEAAIKCRVRAVRKGFVERKTKETKVSVAIDLDGTGVCNANTPIPFLNHMFDVRAPCFSCGCLHGQFTQLLDTFCEQLCCSSSG